MIATIDVGKLFELVWAAALAGVAVAISFSLVILGAARAEDCRRSPTAPRTRSPILNGGFAGIAFLGIAVFGISVITAK